MVVAIFGRITLRHRDAIYQHGLVTQMPTEVTCYTNHRHNRSRVRVTPLGRIVFVCVTGSVYLYPKESVVTSCEHAMSDFVHLCRKRGIVPSDIVTFQNMDPLDPNELQSHLKRYPATVKRDMKHLLRGPKE